MQQIWRWICRNVTSHPPKSLSQLLSIADQKQNAESIPFRLCSTAALWICWKQRNDVCFQNAPPASILTFLAKIKSILIYWSGLWSAEVKQQVLELIGEVEMARQAGEARPRAYNMWSPLGFAEEAQPMERHSWVDNPEGDSTEFGCNTWMIVAGSSGA